MTMHLKPLIWKNIEKSDKDDIWPKKTFGASLIYLDDLKQYFLIGGNHNAFENEKINYDLNSDIIKAADTSIRDYQKSEQAKLAYITQNVTRNYYTENQIDLYVYELSPQRHWYKTTTKGSNPKPRSFQKCIYLSPFIFLYGGVELGPKSENLSNEDMYVLNTRNFEWKHISSNIIPPNRTEFQWVRVISTNNSFLYGGVSSPNEKFYDDMWVFSSDGYNFFKSEAKKSIVRDNLWKQINYSGNSPGKVKAYAMEYAHGYLYLFGGVDNKGKNNNNLYKFNINTSFWEKVNTKGIPPLERCYHEMSLINPDNMVIFGGIKGTLNKIEIMYNDVFLLNLKEDIWVSPLIGGIQPNPRMGFSMCCNYGLKGMGLRSDSYEIMIMGGNVKDNDGYNDKSKTFPKIFIIQEIDPNSTHFWTIRDVKFQEEENDDNFLLQAEKNIYDFKEKIANLELDTRHKELANEDMKNEINEYKKKFFQQHGFIDDQSQSLEDQVKEQETQKNKMKENYQIDQEITDMKIKLKYVMEKKTEKTFEFFNETIGLFMNYFDATQKIILADEKKEVESVFPSNRINEMKNKYQSKLKGLKEKLEDLNKREDNIVTELHRYKNFEKSLGDAFKEEIKKYKIDYDN